MDNKDKNDRQQFEASKIEARSHGYIGSYISGALLFLFSIVLFGIGGIYNLTLIAFGVPVLIFSVLFFFAGAKLKSKHDAARDFVLDWYRNHPEDRPGSTRIVVQESQSNWADDLRELKKLLDEGVITQEEYEKKKQEILSK